MKFYLTILASLLLAGCATQIEFTSNNYTIGISKEISIGAKLEKVIKILGEPLAKSENKHIAIYIYPKDYRNGDIFYCDHVLLYFNSNKTLSKITTNPKGKEYENTAQKRCNYYVSLQNQYNRQAANAWAAASRAFSKTNNTSNFRNSTTNPGNYQQQPQKTIIEGQKTCYNDFDCGYGNKCVKAEGSYKLKGICVVPVNEYGQRDHSNSYNNWGKGTPTEITSCQFDLDCSVGFRCKKRHGEIYGICTKH
ncbi:MAG: hypothetical protein KAQ98_07640 [Bacteriovoracaceae bacterium]|nr:hypothetical protein [Bacteriovoracaceae bacterium]